MAAVLLASSIGLVTVVANYFIPTEAVFSFLLNSSCAVAVVVYLCIVATQFRGRRRLDREAPGSLTLKMWLFLYLTVAVGAVLLAIIVGMAIDSGSRKSRRDLPTTADQIMLAPGSKALLYGALAAIPGDLVLAAPSWVTYAAQAALRRQTGDSGADPRRGRRRTGPCTTRGRVAPSP